MTKASSPDDFVKLHDTVIPGIVGPTNVESTPQLMSKCARCQTIILQEQTWHRLLTTSQNKNTHHRSNTTQHLLLLMADK